MADISELSGDERQQRIAELKRKMQESARQRPASASEESSAAEPDASATPDPASSVSDETEPSSAESETMAAPVAVAEAEVAETDAQEVEEQPSLEVDESEATEEVDEAADEPAAAPEVVTAPVAATTVSGNGASAEQAMVTMPGLDREEVTDPEQLQRSEMNRREFLTYAWGAALGLLVLETGVVSFFFMYPRFKAGEFGGKFFIGPESALPSSEAAPIGNATGKFWLVTTEEQETKAFYMVCTHLGCLYKWEPSSWRFECPCHGSKFDHDGNYIEGPAPRSLDEFPIAVEADGIVSVDTGKKINGASAAESPARVEAG